MRAVLLAIAVGLLVAGCGGSSGGASGQTDDPLSYDDGAPLDLQHGRHSARDGVVVEDVSFASGDDRCEFDIPFVHCISGSVGVGTTTPPGHMQKENTPRGSPPIFGLSARR